jgi:cell division protein FtsA
MYATGIGLVLSGFRALDERDNMYQQVGVGHTQVKENNGTDFFKRILDKTKDLLIDDFDDKDYQ